VVLGIAIATLGSSQILDYVASDNWPSAQGEIVSSQLQTDDDHYYAEIIYAYEVDRTRYTNDRLQFGGTPRTRDQAIAARNVNIYEHGASITLYYHPDYPQNSVIQRQLMGDTVVFFCLGSAFFLAGLMLIGYVIKASITHSVISNRRFVS